jgi:hypothetical protein
MRPQAVRLPNKVSAKRLGKRIDSCGSQDPAKYTMRRRGDPRKAPVRQGPVAGLSTGCSDRSTTVFRRYWSFILGLAKSGPAVAGVR